MMQIYDLYIMKAEESLAGAESEYANGRYNNCANRCYYACFQAAIAALQLAGITPERSGWGHAFVQARFTGQLINRRKQYPSGLRDTLLRTQTLRHTADYASDAVSHVQATRAVRRAREFVSAVRNEVIKT